MKQKLSFILFIVVRFDYLISPQFFLFKHDTLIANDSDRENSDTNPSDRSDRTNNSVYVYFLIILKIKKNGN